MFCQVFIFNKLTEKNRRASTLPVSYTHLDVYKRQAYARGFESKCIANGNRAVVIRGVAAPEHAALEKSTPSRSGWRTQNGSARSGKFQTNPPQKNLQKLGEL